VFPTSVEFQERLFVEESNESLLFEELFEDFHGDEIVINGLSGISVDTGVLKLVVSHLIVPGFEGNADFQELVFYFSENCLYFIGYFGEVMVGELLVFGSDSSHKCPSGKK